MNPDSASAVLALLLSKEGASSAAKADQLAAYGAIECLAHEGAAAISPSLFSRLEELLDTSEADALSPADLTIYQTPEGASCLSQTHSGEMTVVTAKGAMKVHHLFLIIRAS